LPAFGLVRHAGAHDRFGLRRQRRLLRGTQALGLIETRLAGDPGVGIRRQAPVQSGYFGLIECLGIGGGQREDRGQCGGADQAAMKHVCPPWDSRSNA